MTVDTSTSTSNIPAFIDFYLLLDNTPSMGVGATPADDTAMVRQRPPPTSAAIDVVAFACHDVAPGESGRDVSIPWPKTSA